MSHSNFEIYHANLDGRRDETTSNGFLGSLADESKCGEFTRSLVDHRQ